jgi:hypothetical protein
MTDDNGLRLHDPIVHKERYMECVYCSGSISWIALPVPVFIWAVTGCVDPGES